MAHIGHKATAGIAGRPIPVAEGCVGGRAGVLESASNVERGRQQEGAGGGVQRVSGRMRR